MMKPSTRSIKGLICYLNGTILQKGEDSLPAVHIRGSNVNSLKKDILREYKDVAVLITKKRFQVKSTITGSYFIDYSISHEH